MTLKQASNFSKLLADIYENDFDKEQVRSVEQASALLEKMDDYIDAQKEANGFDLRYNTNMSPSEKDWRDCSNVLSRRDFTELMTNGW